MRKQATKWCVGAPPCSNGGFGGSHAASHSLFSMERSARYPGFICTEDGSRISFTNSEGRATNDDTYQRWVMLFIQRLLIAVLELDLGVDVGEVYHRVIERLRN